MVNRVVLKKVAEMFKLSYRANIKTSELEELVVKKCEEEGIDFDDLVEKIAKAENMLDAENDDSEDNIEDIPVETELEEENKEGKKEKKKDKDDLKKITFQQLEKDKNEKARATKDREAYKLIRCTVSCNNKNKVNLQGEIFTAGNDTIPEIKKFIPFNTVTHIPQIIFNTIKEAELQQFRTKKVNGLEIKEPYMTNEYNIQILDSITSDEFSAIKQKQLAENFDKE